MFKDCSFSFSAQNRSALEVDATWLNNTTATVTWMSTYGKKFHFFVRRANYGPNKTMINFGKRRKAVVKFISVAVKSSEDGWETKQTIFKAQVALMKHLSYQIQLAEVSVDDGYNLTASVFLDAHEELAVGRLFAKYG